MKLYEDILNLLGVKLDEVFLCEGFYCKFTKTGLDYYNVVKENWQDANATVFKIISGAVKIEKLPFIPKEGEVYYCISFEVQNNISKKVFNNDTFDNMCIYCGNCFVSFDDAILHKKEIMGKLLEYKNKNGMRF